MQKSLHCSGSRTQEQKKWMNCHFQREKKALKKTVEKSFQVTCISLCVCLSVSVCVCVRVPSHVLLFGTPWAVAHQPPLCMEFSRQ